MAMIGTFETSIQILFKLEVSLGIARIETAAKLLVIAWFY
jgi:hypothetical protein